MEKNNNRVYIIECRKQIEARLNWGDPGLWTNQDFEKLSEEIAGATNVQLSITTLKRIWGKVKYDNVPAVATLDALAQFTGYENWRAFRQRVAATCSLQTNSEPVQETVDIRLNKPAPRSNYTKWLWMTACLLVVTGVAGFYLIKNKSAGGVIDAAHYTFSSRTIVGEGVPNSVVFDYDALAAPSDSVGIQQSWDASKRKTVSKYQHQHTSIYYYPGYFRAKLVVNGNVVKEHDVLIKTKGWLPLVEQDPVPVYFEEGDALHGAELSLPMEKINSKHIQLQPQAPWMRYANVGNWGNVQTNAFRFEAQVRNDYREGSAICQRAEVRLLCNGSAVIIPLCAKGCISDINLLYLGNFYSGKEKDLSMFGVDGSKWNKLRIEGNNKLACIYINDVLALTIPAPEKVFTIEGVDFRFQGLGSVRGVKLEAK
jgi:hypothetical protein